MLRLLALTALALLTLPARGQTDASGDVPPPWELSRAQDGDGPLSAYARLLETEAAWMESDEWRDAYIQTLAQRDAALGRHQSALAMWDRSMGRRRDSVAVLDAGVRAVDAATYIAKRAETERVVMVNEAHHDAATRLLTLRLLPLLYERGYRYLAAETFAPEIDSSVAARGYPAAGDGYYSDEPVFGEMIREAVRLGYTLIPYDDAKPEVENDTLDYQKRRDLTEAEHLRDRIFARDSDAKVLVHAGFGHIEEEVGPRFYPMAVYFRELTGIDPLTIDQVTMAAASEPAFDTPLRRGADEAGLLGDVPALLLGASGEPLAPVRYSVDLQSFAPRVERPVLALPGRRLATVTAPEVCARVLCLVEVRLANEGPDAVPLDRLVVDAPGPVTVSARGQALVQILDGETGVVLLEHALSDD